MRPLVARLLAVGLMVLAGAAAAQEPARPGGSEPAARGPYVGDETHRAPLESDVPFPEGVTPPERPAWAPSVRRTGRSRAHRAALSHHSRHGGTRSRHRHRR